MWRSLTILIVGFGAQTIGLAFAHPHNDVEEIRPPQPDFPALASWLGLSGSCEVVFSVYDYGDTVIVDSARCSSVVFCKAAIQSIRDAELRVIDAADTNKPGIRSNIVYPLEFVYDDQLAPTVELVDCEMPEPLA